MRFKFISVVIIIGNFVLGGLLRIILANGEETENILKAIQQKYKTVERLEAKFVQTNYIATLDQFREFKGKIFFKKPYFFDMEVNYPTNQRQTFDGQYLWIYTPANNQVLKSQISPDIINHPLISLLSTMENLEKDFFIEANEKDLRVALKMILKEPHSEVRELLVALEKDDYRIKELTICFESGNYTRIVLDKVKENLEIPAQQFHFSPPRGVEVVEPPRPSTVQ
ncbi:MAG: outer membrane lipoprotein chaperone LolA [Desulfobacterota bacterium]|nr:outer membrane lipoprotein chaperone LolA [Thermodesulfobacteriota bacterium]